MFENINIIEIFTTIFSLIAAICALIGNLQKRKIDQLNTKVSNLSEKLNKRENELFDIYKDAEQFQNIVEDLRKELNKSKVQVRKGYNFSRRSTPSAMNNRITQLNKKK